MHAAHPLPHGDALAGPALTGAGSVWWLAQTLAHYGPSWEALGPILMGLAAVYHGRANLVRARQDRGHRP